MGWSPEARAAREALAAVVLEHGPPPKPVRFRSRDLPAGTFGVTYMGADDFTVVLRRGQCPGCLTDTIVHELAHVYAWTDGAEWRDDHDEIFGVFYSRIYRAVRGTH